MHPSRMTTASINPRTYTPCPVATVAFLGLGVMGYPMAAIWRRRAMPSPSTTAPLPNQ